MNGRCDTQPNEAPAHYFGLMPKPSSHSPRALAITKDGQKRSFHIAVQQKISFDEINSCSEKNFKSSAYSPQLSVLRTFSDQTYNEESAIDSFNLHFTRKVPSEPKNECRLGRPSGRLKPKLAVKTEENSQLVFDYFKTKCGQKRTEERKEAIASSPSLLKTAESPIKKWQVTWEKASRTGTLSSVFSKHKQRNLTETRFKRPASKQKTIRRIKTSYKKSKWMVDPEWYRHLRIKESNVRFLMHFQRRIYKTVSTQTEPVQLLDMGIGLLRNTVTTPCYINGLLLTVALLVGLVCLSAFTDVKTLLQRFLCYTLRMCPAPVHPILRLWNLLRNECMIC